MYSRKSVGPKIELWESPAWTGYSCGDFPSRTTRSRLLLRKKEIRPNACHASCQISSMPNPVKNLGYIMYYRSRSPKPVKTSSNSIRYNSQKICSGSSRPKVILEIRKKTFLYVINNPIIHKSFKDLNNHRKKNNREVVTFFSFTFSF